MGGKKGNKGKMEGKGGEGKEKERETKYAQAPCTLSPAVLIGWCEP